MYGIKIMQEVIDNKSTTVTVLSDFFVVYALYLPMAAMMPSAHVVEVCSATNFEIQVQIEVLNPVEELKCEH